MCQCDSIGKVLRTFERVFERQNLLIRNLLTRIQGWEPESHEGTASQVVRSSPAKPADAKLLTDEDLAMKFGLARNPDGGYIDVETGTLFDSLEMGIACKSFAKNHGIPLKDAITIVSGGTQ